MNQATKQSLRFPMRDFGLPVLEDDRPQVLLARPMLRKCEWPKGGGGEDNDQTLTLHPVLTDVGSWIASCYC